MVLDGDWNNVIDTTTSACDSIWASTARVQGVGNFPIDPSDILPSLIVTTNVNAALLYSVYTRHVSAGEILVQASAQERP